MYTHEINNDDLKSKFLVMYVKVQVMVTENWIAFVRLKCYNKTKMRIRSGAVIGEGFATKRLHLDVLWSWKICGYLESTSSRNARMKDSDLLNAGITVLADEILDY